MALALLRDVMPRKNLQSGKTGRQPGKTGRRGRGNRRVGSSGFGTMNPVNFGDLRVKPPSMSNVPTSVPRNIQRQVVWDVVKIQSTYSLTASLIETNFIFQLNQNPQYTSWTSIFDQYSIPLVTIEFDSTVPAGDSNASPILYTALDFDNATNLGSVSAITGYDTCESVVMTPQMRHMRSIRPSPKVVAQQSGGGNAQSVTSGPLWVDSSNPSLNFYGIRSIATSTVPAFIFNVVLTAYYCFRGRV